MTDTRITIASRSRGRPIPPPPPPRLQPASLARKPRLGDILIRILLFGCALISILTTVGIVLALGREALRFFQTPGVTLGGFFGLADPRWLPEVGVYSIWPLLGATLRSSLIAMAVALPIGLCAAIYLSEYASPRARGILKPTLEVLAGVPTVVYGYFALTFMTPLLRSAFGVDTVQIYNVASAGLVMGVMIVPLISSMSEDALSAVPRGLREGAYGLGATRLETSLRVVVPAAMSGIIAAVIVGVSRAVGETMIVAIAAGAGPNWTVNPFLAAETITGHIARISGGDLAFDTIQYDSIFALGLVLFFFTLGLNLLARAFIRRFQEVYE